MQYVDVVFKSEDGAVLAKLAASEKHFSTGSRGFYTQGKVVIDGKLYQCQTQLVEIGSKARLAGV